jgi:GT2 family glycosyltransferase
MHPHTRALFEELGRFDSALAPAYYEDTDYAFKVRDAGRKVYYQPFATVVHHEGQSCGTSTDSGVKAYQLVNAVKFRTKWQHRLDLHPRGTQLARIAQGSRHRKARARGRCENPLSRSGFRLAAMMNLLLIFQQLGFKVTFLPETGCIIRLTRSGCRSSASNASTRHSSATSATF